MERVKGVTEWLSDSSGSGSGYGYGYGRGDSSGSGSGSGSGRGSGYGSGSGSGSGSGYGTGRTGSGFRYGDGYGVKSINGEAVHYVDDVPTIITKFRGNVAHGYIVNFANFSREKCYVVKGEGSYAHGKTLVEARAALLAKILDDRPVEERLEMFCRTFPKGKKAKGSEYFEWHHILTGSCKAGREAFVESRGIDLSQEYTPEEFIAYTRDSYGSDIIRKLEAIYKKGTSKNE